MNEEERKRFEDTVEYLDPRHFDPGTRVRQRATGRIGTVCSTIIYPSRFGRDRIKVDVKWDEASPTANGYSTLNIRLLEHLPPEVS